MSVVAAWRFADDEARLQFERLPSDIQALFREQLETPRGGDAGPTGRLQRLPPADRPRERARALGLSALSSVELVALLLGQGTPGKGVLELASSLVEEVGGVVALAKADADELVRPGIGTAKSLRIAAAFELGRRADIERSGPGIWVRSSADLARAARSRLRDEHQEVLLLVLLSSRLRVEGIRELARGSFVGAALPLQEVLAAVLRAGVPRFALAHNHPSGDPTPSREDESLTARVAAGAALLGLELVDHVIVGAGGQHYSAGDAGLLDPSYGRSEAS